MTHFQHHEKTPPYTSERYAREQIVAQMLTDEFTACGFSEKQIQNFQQVVALYLMGRPEGDMLIMQHLLEGIHIPLNGPEPRSALKSTPYSLSQVSRSVIRALTNDIIGSTGLHEHVLPHDKKDNLVVFVANQHSVADAAAISHVLDTLAPRRLVELSCSDSYPDARIRTLLQLGRVVVHTSETVESVLGTHLDQLSGSPVEKLLTATHTEGRWPLIFGEAQSCTALETRAERLRTDPFFLPPEIGPFRWGSLQPWMTDTLEKCGVDPARVQIIPVRVLHTSQLLNARMSCQSEEASVLVKFGAATPLTELRQRFGTRGERRNLLLAASFMRDRIWDLGTDYDLGVGGTYRVVDDY